MTVQNIEYYGDTLKVILKPTDKFPAGRNYFYCDSDAKTLDLVNNYSWHLQKQGKNTYVEAISGDSHLRFHREYAYSILDSYPTCIDHINGVDFDNTDNNLNPVTNQQNGYNQPTRGYYFNKRDRNFQPCIIFNRKNHYPYRVVHSELDACQLAHLSETDYLKSLMKKDEYYMYNFLKDRRNDLDILDLERTKQISAEEATYRHVLRYARDNAWYYYRYNLEQYFKDNNIQVPNYSFDTDGFMIHPITGKKLCPF